MKQMKLVLALLLVALTIGNACAVFAQPALADINAPDTADQTATHASAEDPASETPDVPDELDDPSPETSDPFTRTVYAKKKINLYKAKKTSSKILAKIPNKAELEAGAKGKTWTLVRYDGEIGYARTVNLTEKSPTPAPTPNPGQRMIALPTSTADTIYAGDTESIAVAVAEVVSAIVVDSMGMSEGYFNRVNTLVSTHMSTVLSGDMPEELEQYAVPVSAAAQDITNGMVIDLLGAQYGAQRNKTFTIFNKSGTVISGSLMVAEEDGTELFTFDSFKVKANTSKGTYYLQLRLNKKDAPSIYALYPDADTITILAPVKVAKRSSGGGIGGGGGSSSGEKQVATPRLIIDGTVRTEPANPLAGEAFDLIVPVRNTSESLYLRNILLSFTADDDAINSVSGSNTEYINRIDAGASEDLRLHVIARPDLEASKVKIDLRAEFEDTRFNSLSADLGMTVEVTPILRMEADDPTLSDTSEIYVNDNAEVEMTVYNKGKTKLYNVTVRAIPDEPEVLSGGQAFFAGDMEPASSIVAKLKLSPIVEGTHTAKIQISYETLEGKPTEVERDFSLTAVPEPTWDFEEQDPYPIDYDEPEPQSIMEVLAMLPPPIYVLGAGLLTVLILSAGLSIHRRRVRALEDDEMD